MWDQQEPVLQEPCGREGCQWAADRMYLLPKTVPPLQLRETPERGMPRQVCTTHTYTKTHFFPDKKSALLVVTTQLKAGRNQFPHKCSKTIKLNTLIKWNGNVLCTYSTKHLQYDYIYVCVCVCGNSAQHHTGLIWGRWRSMWPATSEEKTSWCDHRLCLLCVRLCETLRFIEFECLKSYEVVAIATGDPA